MTRISEDRYHEEVETHARILEERVENDEEHEDPERAAFELSREVVDGHPWFVEGGSMGPAAHGEIIEYRETPPRAFNDLDAYIEGKSPEDVVRTIAFLCFEADVMNTADVL